MMNLGQPAVLFVPPVYQVISTVCRVCMQGLDSQTNSTTTSTVLMLLAALLRTAVAEVIDADASGASNTDLQAEVCNQLTQSGLLQQLPEAMQVTARLLAETATQHNLSSSNGSTSDSACGSCTHSTSTSSCCIDGPSMSALSHVFLVAREVLDIYSVLHVVWSPDPLGQVAKLTASAPAAAPALQLIMASVHAVDQQLQQQQTLMGDDLAAAHSMLPCVQRCLQQLVLNPDYKEGGAGEEVPHADNAGGRALVEAALSLQAAKSSSKYLHCLSYSLLVLSIASMPALQQLAADRQAAGSAEAPLDEVAASLLQQADSLQNGLHPSQQQLAALLGLKPRTLLRAAAAVAAVVPTDFGPLPEGGTSVLLTAFLAAHRRLSYLHTSATPQQLQTWMQQQQHWERDLGLLQWGVCTALQWAASLPHQHSISWSTAVAAADSAVLAWEAVDKASRLQGPTSSDRLAVCEQQHSQWADCLLLPALQLSAVMCQHMQQLLLSGSSGSGSTSGPVLSTVGSSSGAQGAASGAVSNSVSWEAGLSSLLSSLASMVMLQVSLVQAKGIDAEKVMQQGGSSSGAGSPPSRPLSAAAAQHLVGLLEALEGFTRCVAAASATHPDLFQRKVVRALTDVADLCHTLALSAADGASPVLGAVAAAGSGSSALKQLYSLMPCDKPCQGQQVLWCKGPDSGPLWYRRYHHIIRCPNGSKCWCCNQRSQAGRCRHASSRGLSPSLFHHPPKLGSGWPHVQHLGTTAAAGGANTAAGNCSSCCLEQFCA